MAHTTGNPLEIYVRVLTVSYVLFMKALQLLAELGEYAITDMKFFRNPQIQTALKNIKMTLATCGCSLSRLPSPPPGAEGADQKIRNLGREIYSFGEVLNQLASEKDAEQRKCIMDEYQNRATKIRVGFREAVEDFERVYPGGLTKVLQHQKQSLLE